MEMMERETSIVDDFFQDRQSDREASTLRDALRITSGPTRITRRARQLLARQILSSAQRYETATPFFVIWRRFALTLIFWATLLDVGNLGILYVAIYWKIFDALDMPESKSKFVTFYRAYTLLWVLQIVVFGFVVFLTGKALVGEAEGYEMPAAGHRHLGGRLYLNLETYADDADADKPFVLRLLVDFVDAGGRRTTPFPRGLRAAEGEPRTRSDQRPDRVLELDRSAAASTFDGVFAVRKRSAVVYHVTVPAAVVLGRHVLTLERARPARTPSGAGRRRSGDLERALLDDDDDATLAEAVPVTISDPDFEHRKLVRLEQALRAVEAKVETLAPQVADIFERLGEDDPAGFTPTATRRVPDARARRRSRAASRARPRRASRPTSPPADEDAARDRADETWRAKAAEETGVLARLRRAKDALAKALVAEPDTKVRERAEDDTAAILDAIGDYDDALMFLRSGTAFVKAGFGGVAHYACTLWLAVEGGGMQLRWSRNTSGKVSFMDLGDVVRVGLLGSRSVVVEAAGDRTKKFKLARPGLAQQYLSCLELVLAARRGADAV
ncbi:sulfuric ester hydrolase [Aureococcus anophagefferens]|uniref:Sulfuric ester hydrolase n=1 Tax=Aureococcus anophagefferens TaxID=44056 RepID=A0ABR1FXW9_AURAN